MNNKQDFVNELIDNESFQRHILFGNEKDVVYWKRWLSENADKEDCYLEAKKALTSFKIKPVDINAAYYEQDLEKLKVAIEKHKKSIYKKINFNAFLRYAAVVLISFGVGFSVFKMTGNTTEAISIVSNYEKSNPKGQKSIIMLPDGSKVYLNSASSLSYEKDPILGNRNIYLKGEAFFEVRKDKNSPFVVYSNGIKTIALGTSFNVNAYEDEKEVEVFLKTGKVEVQSNNNFFYLSPGEGIRFNVASNQLAKISTTSEKASGWKSEIIILDNESIGEVTRKLEKWYGVTINVEGIPNRAWSVNGEFDNESLENILKSLSFTSSFNYEINEDVVTLKFK